MFGVGAFLLQPRNGFMEMNYVHIQFRPMLRWKKATKHSH